MLFLTYFKNWRVVWMGKMQFIGWRRELGKGEKTEEQKNIR